MARRDTARTMLGASGLTVLGAIAPFLLGAQAVLMQRDLGFGPARLGLAVSVFFGVAALGTILGLPALSRLGRGAGLVVAGGLVAVGGLLVATVVQDWWGLVLAMAVIPVLSERITVIDAAIIALVINTGAYSAEILRAGLQSIPKGEVEAAGCLALSRWQTFWYVELPQVAEKARLGRGLPNRRWIEARKTDKADKAVAVLGQKRQGSHGYRGEQSKNGPGHVAAAVGKGRCRFSKLQGVSIFANCIEVNDPPCKCRKYSMHLERLARVDAVCARNIPCLVEQTSCGRQISAVQVEISHPAKQARQ